MREPDILSPEFAADPYSFYKVMRDHHPLIYHERMNCYIISRYDDVKRAFTDSTFSTRNYDWQLEPVYGYTIIQMDGKEHSRHRNTLNSAFRGKDLFKKFIPVIEKNTRDLITAFSKGRGEIEFVSQFTHLLPISVIVDMMGLPKSDLSKFQKWYVSKVAFLSNLVQDAKVHENGLKAKAEFTKYMSEVVAKRRKNPGEDLLSTLCTAEIDGVQMTDVEIVSFCALLLTAGGESTDKAIALLLKNLIEHPDQMQAVRNDRSLVDKAFAETLRYSPPVQMIMRQPIEDVELSGGVIPANSTVTCLIGAANRDEEHYDHPDRFDIFRKEIDDKHSFTGAANHMAFGAGRHFCVGSLLSKADGNIAINLLLDHLENIQFKDGKAPKDIGLFTRAPQEMHLTFNYKEVAV